MWLHPACGKSATCLTYKVEEMGRPMWGNGGWLRERSDHEEGGSAFQECSLPPKGSPLK